MSKRIRRNEDGQFAAGQSGNPEGARLRKPKELLTPLDLHRTILEVAGETVATRNGKPVTRYENCARALATGGSASRLGLRDFMEITRGAAYFLERLEHQRALKGRRP